MKQIILYDKHDVKRIAFIDNIGRLPTVTFVHYEGKKKISSHYELISDIRKVLEDYDG